MVFSDGYMSYVQEKNLVVQSSFEVLRDLLWIDSNTSETNCRIKGTLELMYIIDMDLCYRVNHREDPRAQIWYRKKTTLVKRYF